MAQYSEHGGIWATAAVGAATLAAAGILGFQPAPVAGADCSGTQVDLQPISDLGPDVWRGFQGGLYPGGENVVPGAHMAMAIARSRAIVPLDDRGQPAPGGRVVVLSVGMSNTTQEFQRFMAVAGADSQVNPAVLLVDGAQGGQTAAEIQDPAARFWDVVDQRLATAGATADQVQIIWMKEADARPTGDAVDHARQLQQEFGAIARVAADRFDQLQLFYLSSRTYAGYASSALNPEPFAYASGWAVKWLVQAQIDGAPDLDPGPGGAAPLLLWGPYLWANGLQPRSDGLTWACQDFAADGTHPSESGRDKVAGLLLGFFKSDAASRPWFMVDPEATPAPTPTGTQGTATPSPLESYRIRETPTGDGLWVSSTDPVIARRMANVSPSRSAWLCGRVVEAASAEWGFVLAEDTLRLERTAPQGDQTTIRRVAADPRWAVAAGPQCLHIDGFTAAVNGPPPGAPTPTTGRPSPTATPGPTQGASPTAEVWPLVRVFLPALAPPDPGS